LIAAVLSLGILVLWQWLFPPAPPVAAPEPPAAMERAASTEEFGVEGNSRGAAAEPAVASSSGSAATEPTPTEVLEPIEGTLEQQVVLETGRWQATFSNRGGVLTSLVLKARKTADGQPLELVRARQDTAPSPFALVDPGGERLPVNEALFQVEESRSAVTFRYAGPLGDAAKTFSVSDQVAGDFLDLEISSTLPDWNLWLGPGLRNPPWSELDDRFQKRYRDVTYLKAGEVEQIVADKIEGSLRIEAEPAGWVSLQDKYFLSALLPSASLAAARVVPVALNGDSDTGLAGFEILADAAGESRPIDLGLVLVPRAGRLELSTYWGAKQYVELKELGKGLEQTVQWGKLGFIAKPLLYGLRWLHDNVTSNYGWCIVLMTLLLRIALLPLTHTSFVSMQKMQQLNPRMEAIRARHRPKLKDKQGRPNFEQQRKMNEEIQALFKAEKVNPAAGCLPLLLQMPIFFAFYQLLVQAVELWGAPWALWIHDLSSRDPIWVLPLVMGGTQLLQQRLMPSSPNPTQKMIMNTMPIFFTVFALNFPAGLVLYWLTNNILTIAQQAGYNRLKKAGWFGGETPSTGAKEKR
jgi:YidC/Oxa1 family membrane protein insertase